MATTEYFNEKVRDQGGKVSMNVEIGRSSYYSGCDLPSGAGVDSIYLTVDDKTVLMDRETARSFIEAAMSLGFYFGIVD